MTAATRRTLLRHLAGLCGLRLARGQQTPVFTTEIKVVNVLATVHNKTGQLIGGLNRVDFSIAEDGRPQEIRYFARETDLPLTLGLMIDTSGSQGKVLDAERGASLRFLDEVMRPNKDKVFIMQFDSAVTMRQALTSNIGKLDDSLAYVDTETRAQIIRQDGGGTLLYDAVARASDDTMSKLTGRKALIVLSDGVDFGSHIELQDAVDAAVRADTLVYSILYADSAYYGPFGGREGRRALQGMSEQTGGGYFEVSRKQPVDRVFAILEEELRNQYNIGYVSDRPVTISEFRKIEAAVKGKGLTVQARRRYWARP